jgi:hypothetical protein
VETVKNTGTPSGMMTEYVVFKINDISKARAFWAAIKSKYPQVLGEDSNETYCSKYTCWHNYNGYQEVNFNARPTPYTISILDNVKIDASGI